MCSTTWQTRIRRSCNCGSDYYLSYAATLTQSGPTDPLLDFSIIGRGPRVSRLLIPNVVTLDKPLGAFAISFSSNESGFEAREFSVIATGALEAEAGSGTAILANFPGLLGVDEDTSPGNHRAALVSHVEIGTDDNQIDGISWSYFDNGLDLTGAANLLVFDVVITGASGPNSFYTNTCSDVVGELADDSPAFLSTCHVVINDCYGPTLIALRLACAQTGISHVTTGITPNTQGPQGFYMSKIDIDRVKTGFVQHQVDSMGASVDCPVGMIQDSYFAFRDVGLDLANIFKWQVHGCDFYNHGNGVNVGGDCVGGTAYDIHLRNANIVNVMGCRFNRPASPKRVHVFVDGDDTCMGTPAFAENVLIGQNHYLPQQSSVPSNPGSGWVLYTDPGGDLYARYSTGAPIRLLAHP